MTQQKKPKTAINMPSFDLIAQAIHEGETLIAERRPEVEAEAAIYRLLENRP